MSKVLVVKSSRQTSDLYSFGGWLRGRGGWTSRGWSWLGGRVARSVKTWSEVEVFEWSSGRRSKVENRCQLFCINLEINHRRLRTPTSSRSLCIFASWHVASELLTSDLSTSDLRPLNVQPPRRLDLQPSPSVSLTTPFSLGISIRASTISSRRLSISSSLVLSSSSGSFADLSVSS